VIASLTSRTAETDIFDDAAVVAVVDEAFERGDFTPSITCTVVTHVVDKSLYDGEYLERKIAETRAANPPGTPNDDIKRAVIEHTVKKVINVKELKKFLPADVVDQIVRETAEEAFGDMTDIKSIAERKIEAAIRGKRVITPVIKRLIQPDLLAAVTGGLRHLRIDPTLVRDGDRLRGSVIEALLATPRYGALARLIVERRVVDGALQGLDDAAIMDHPDAWLLCPTGTEGVFCFLVSDISQLSQFRNERGHWGGTEDPEEVRKSEFIRSFNDTFDTGPKRIIRLAPLQRHLQEAVWAQLSRERSLRFLLSFYESRERDFAGILKVVVEAKTSKESDRAFLEISGRRMFEGVLKPEYVEHPEANKSLFEALTIAKNLHILCQTERGESPFIGAILDECLIDPLGQLDDRLDYYFRDWNLPGEGDKRRDEKMVIIGFRPRDSCTIQAFGLWTDHSLVAVSASQAAIAAGSADAGGAPRQITDGGCSAAAAAASSAASSAVRSVAPPPIGGPTRQTAADTRSAPKPVKGSAPAGKRGGAAAASGNPDNKRCIVM
jgi:hypothetical protein